MARASAPVTYAADGAPAQSFLPGVGESKIDLCRNETFGAANSITITRSGDIAGQTASVTYFLWKVAPDAYETLSLTENGTTFKLHVH